MNENKKIDRLFQEKFKDFEVFPDNIVWENIEQQITKKKKRRIVPLWLRFGGAAAILLILISSGFWYFNRPTIGQDVPNEIIITDTDKNDNLLNESNSIDQKEVELDPDPVQTGQKQNLISISTQKNNQSTSNRPKTLEKVNNLKEINHSKLQNETEIKVAVNSSQEIEIKNKIENLNEFKETETLIALDDKSDKEKDPVDDIQNELDKTETEDVSEITRKSKWSIGSTLAPVYFNSLSDGSPIDVSLANNEKSSNASVSYGLKINYRLSDKLSVQSGINTLELGYKTENVATLLSSSLLDNTSTNIDTNVEGVSLAVLSTTAQGSDLPNQRSSFDNSGFLDQTLGYVEIPMELKYNLLQKKLGVNMLGGFSTYFLYRNHVAVTSFGKTTTLGEASNINSLNFSGNIGLDFDYNISKKLYINISPMFKYQFNTFSRSAGGFQPYYFGIYSGLNFRF